MRRFSQWMAVDFSRLIVGVSVKIKTLSRTAQMRTRKAKEEDEK